MKLQMTTLLAMGLCGLLASAENLLENGHFDIGAGQSVPRWIFPPSVAKAHAAHIGYIERGVATAFSGESCLRLAVTQPEKTHLWWQQEVSVLSGTVYQLNVRYVGRVETGGDDKSYGSPDIGVYFLDTSGKWIGYKRLQPAPKLDSEWKQASLKFTTPDNASKVGVRLGALGNSEMEILFDEAQLIFAE